MKKTILSISFLFPLFLFAQSTRILNGTYSDGSFGKKIPDTVRTLIAGTNVAIASGGSSLVDTISATGSGGITGSGANTRLTYWTGTSSISSSSNLIWDNTNYYLGIGGTPSYPFHIQTNANSTQRIRITNSNTGSSAFTQIDAAEGVTSFQAGVAGPNATTSGLLKAASVYFQSNAGSGLVFRSIESGTYPYSYIVFGIGSGGNQEALRIFHNGSVGINVSGADSSAYLTLSNATTSLAQIRLQPSGVSPSSPVNGQIWYLSTGNVLNLQRGSTTYEILSTASVNTVSPTSPNRTITVTIGGTTYYIAAKTTND